MGSGVPERELSVGDAADLWGVSRGTVYYWIRTGVLTCFHPGPDGDAVASWNEVARAQVLQRRELLARGIAKGLLQRAIREGIVHPTNGRFSLRDLDAIAEWPGRPRHEGAPSGPPPGRRASGFTRKALDWDEQDEMAWVERGADPSELPDSYFDLPSPPRFIPPPDVWRFAFDLPVLGKPGARYVWRSAGYERAGDQLVWCEENDRFAIVGEKEPMPRTWIESNRTYRLAEERWVRAWWSRRPREGER